MGLLTLFCVITIAFTGLASGAGVFPNDSVTAVVGDSVTFNTSVTPTTTPLYLISWEFGITTIVTSFAGEILYSPVYKERLSLSVFDGFLELRNVAASDNGEYTVNIKLTEGNETITESTTLNVYERVYNARVTASSTDLVEFNDTVTLSCSASGSELSFLWFNGSAEVKASDRVKFSEQNNTVTTDPVLQYDQESYSCKAFNPVSSSTSDPISLSVSYGPKSVTLTPPPLDDNEEGSVVPLSCSANSRPEAQFRWLLNGELLSYTGAEIDLKLEQSGNYSCQAFNSKTQRYTTSQPAELTVWKKIENPVVKPSNRPVEGSSVNLTCDASGSILTREWTVNGTEIKLSGNTFYDEKRILSFKNLTTKNNGKYTCIISNPFSSQSADYTMDVSSRPPPRSGCNTGCIVGIVIGVIAVILIVGGVTFFMLKKKKQKPKSNTRTDGEGQDNRTNAQNQEVHYADVRFVKRGGVVKGEGQNIPEYAQVQKKNRPQASNLPSYNAHMQRDRRPDPDSTTVYADVRVK